jgi:beta-glucosidase
MKGRTYRYFTGAPLYPFGYGLSYTTFSYSGLTLPNDFVNGGHPMTANAIVTNKGTVAGDEVAQLYLTFPGVPGAPLRALRGFKRVHLNAGESQTVHFELAARDLSMVTDAGEPIVAAGEYKLFIGGGQPNESTAGVSGKFVVKGTTQLPE